MIGLSFVSPHALALLGRITSTVLVLAASTGPAHPTLVPGDPAGALMAVDTGTVAFMNVNVVPMDRERVLRDQTVVVRDGVIAEMAASGALQPPAGARVVDGAGHYLVPGLTEMHAHIPSPDQGEDVLDRTLFLFLANGVTTIRGMLGHPAHLELRVRSERGEALAPRVYTSGPSLNGNSAPTPDVARRMVREQQAAGYDFVKIHPGLTRAVFDAAVETAREVGIPLAGHVPADVGLDAALAAGVASIDHLDSYIEAMAGHGGGFAGQESGFFGLNLTDRIDTDRIPELAAATREAGVWNVPTQTLMEHLLSPEPPDAMADWPEMRYMPAATVERWVEVKRSRAVGDEQAARYIDARRRLIRALHEAGAGLVLGSDAPQFWNVPGFSLHRELRMMVESGLTPYEALAMGTRNAARYFDSEDWGILEPGRAADMILVEANPLEDIGNLTRRAGVMVRGRWLPESEIQERLDGIARAVR